MLDLTYTDEPIEPKRLKLPLSYDDRRLCERQLSKLLRLMQHEKYIRDKHADAIRSICQEYEWQGGHTRSLSDRQWMFVHRRYQDAWDAVIGGKRRPEHGGPRQRSPEVLEDGTQVYPEGATGKTWLAAKESVLRGAPLRRNEGASATDTERMDSSASTTKPKRVARKGRQDSSYYVGALDE